MAFFEAKKYCRKAIIISATSGINLKKFLQPVLELITEGEPFYTGDDISDLPTRFFVVELIRGKEL
jgi:GTP-binding protein Era